MSHGGSGLGGRGRKREFEAKRNVSRETAPLKVWNIVCGLGLCPSMSLRSLVERGHEKIAWCVEWGWRRLRAPARSG